jgi:hypothetical protein
LKLQTTGESRQPTPALQYYWKGTLQRVKSLKVFGPDDGSLTEEQAASTVYRFFRSDLIAELRLIFKVAIALFVLYFVSVVILGAGGHLGVSGGGADSKGYLVTYIGPATTIVGAVLAWTYLTASNRLGIIDLFACEIGTLCRVGTVLNIGKQLVDMYHAKDDMTQGKPTSIGNFVSKEDYFPIFGHNSGSLQSLESLIVIRITEFYTYMKATRDLQRKLADIDGVKNASPSSGAGKAALADMVYMLFLGYESGRKAIEKLIEYEPTKAETRIVMLLTELVLYGLLCEHYAGQEPWCSRLDLREKDYRRDVTELRATVEAANADDENWSKARKVAEELGKRFNDALTMKNEAQQKCLRPILS